MKASALEIIAGHPVHPIASEFPLMPDAELAELARNIKENGQREAIVLYRDQVLDGRNRLRACELANVKPKFVEYRGEDSPADLADYVADLNLSRRHLTQDQRALIASRLLPFYESEAKERQRAAGGDQRSRPTQPRAVSAPGALTGKAAAKVAAKYQVGTRTLERAKTVAIKAPELVEKVRAGELTLKRAEKQIRHAELVEKVKVYEPPTGQYAVIVADPPWPYEDELSGDGARGGLPYPAMTVAEIYALQIPAAEDCILWLWVTNAHLIDGTATRALEAWGFEHPKTLLTWVKPSIGAGRWLRGQTEHCILAVKGHPTISLKGQSTYLPAPRGPHSRKPDEFFALVESLCPSPSRCELFARETRPGWVTSGAELPSPPPAIAQPKCRVCGAYTLGHVCYPCSQKEARERKKAERAAARSLIVDVEPGETEEAAEARARGGGR